MVLLEKEIVMKKIFLEPMLSYQSNDAYQSVYTAPMTPRHG